jgi:hypothetical protein
MKIHTSLGCVVFLLIVSQFAWAASVSQPSSIIVPAASASGAFKVSWTASKTAGASYELQESSDPAFATSATATIYRGTALSKNISGKTTGHNYYYRVRAVKTGLTSSLYSLASNGCAVPGVTKNVTPSSIVVPLYDTDGAYQVKWGQSSSSGVQYLLQEATNSQFSTGLRAAYKGVGTAVNIAGKPQNSNYFYRVKAIKAGIQDSNWKVGSNSCGVPDSPLARNFIAATQSCGTLSPNTVPDTWGVAAVRTSQEGTYCETWVPPFWQSTPFGSSGNVFSDPTGTKGATLMSGIPAGMQACTPAAYTQWYIGLLTASGTSCKSPRIEHYEEGVDNWFGMQFQTARFVFTCVKNGVPLVAGAYGGVSNGLFCSTVSWGQWMPTSGTPADVCVNAQVLNGQKCGPIGSELCGKPECSNNCRAQGHTGGYCNSFEQCVCH